MENIKEYYKHKKEELKKLAEGKDLTLCIIQVGNNEASNRYIKNKIKDANDCGIKTELVKFDENISQTILGEEVEKLSLSDKYDGVIVQLPLPTHIDENYILGRIDSDTDVDGLSLSPKVFPATPQGIITYLEDQHYEFKDKNAVVIGRSKLVGKPMAQLLLNHDCNVTVLHSKTSKKNLYNYLTNADLVVCATGHRNTLTNESFAVMGNNKAFLVDVGINFDENGKLVGDCENVDYVEKTPVPGGVGLLTRLALIQNLLKLNCII